MQNVRTLRGLVTLDGGSQNMPGWYGDFNKTFKCHSRGFIRLRNSSNEMGISVDYADNCNDGFRLICYGFGYEQWRCVWSLRVYLDDFVVLC